MAENDHPDDEPVIGFAFDGTGYGDDGAVWGGEFMIATYADYRRVGHLRYTSLPGGDAGVRNPCRMALSHLDAAGLDWDPGLPSVAACTPVERAVLRRQLDTGLNTAPTSSIGRLFDAVSSLAGVCQRVTYEAEAAMRFEGLARAEIERVDHPYGFGIDDHLIADPSPVLRAAVADVQRGESAAVVAARFHRAVADLVIMVAERLREQTAITAVALSGGVFLNVLLTQLCAERLQSRDFRVLRHQQVPPSDAGIALGQLMIGARMRTGRSPICV